MIDSIGGPTRVNNMLTTLNLKSISDKNLKKMERRAGVFIEEYASGSMKHAAQKSYNDEMW